MVRLVLPLGSLMLAFTCACSGSDSNPNQPVPVPDCSLDPSLPECLQPCGSSSCNNCSCPEGEECKEGFGCLGTAKVGEACGTDFDCATGNCSELALVCRVEIGATCTASDCDRCLSHEDGWSFCSRDCTGSSRSCGEYACLGTTALFENDTGLLTCRPQCEVDCPTRCSDIASGGQFCDCEPDVPGCEVLNPPRPMGELCRADVQCESLDCYNRTRLGGDGPPTGELGRCTIDCSSDDACIEGYRCVGVSCDENGVTGCSGQKCLPTCDDATDCEVVVLNAEVGICVLRRPTEGPDVTVCDVRPDQI